MLQTFKEKNRDNFPNELLEKLSMKDLFKPTYLTSLMQNYPNQEQKFFNKMNPNFGLNLNYLNVPHPHSYTQPDLYNIGHYYQNMNFTPNTISMDQMGIPRNSNNLQLPVIGSFPHINSELNLKNIPSLLNQGKAHKLFSTTNLNNSLLHTHPSTDIGSDFMSRKRKRFIKNNKLVFVQADSAAAKKLELDSGAIECKDEDLTKLENLNEMSEGNGLEMTSMEETLAKGRKPRGSRYRGVSRNGNQWQVLIMVNKKKRYVGSYSNEEEAARAYDKVALQNHGAKAKTNFDYTEEEVQKILGDPPLLKLN